MWASARERARPAASLLLGRLLVGDAAQLLPLAGLLLGPRAPASLLLRLRHRRGIDARPPGRGLGLDLLARLVRRARHRPSAFSLSSWAILASSSRTRCWATAAESAGAPASGGGAGAEVHGVRNQPALPRGDDRAEEAERSARAPRRPSGRRGAPSVIRCAASRAALSRVARRARARARPVRKSRRGRRPLGRGQAPALDQRRGGTSASSPPRRCGAGRAAGGRGCAGPGSGSVSTAPGTGRFSTATNSP